MYKFRKGKDVGGKRACGSCWWYLGIGGRDLVNNNLSINLYKMFFLFISLIIMKI